MNLLSKQVQKMCYTVFVKLGLQHFYLLLRSLHYYPVGKYIIRYWKLTYIKYNSKQAKTVHDKVQGDNRNNDVCKLSATDTQNRYHDKNCYSMKDDHIY